ncbi:MAG: sterol desaturase family protein [Proteobacteria bacterium]|nr:sterol desaturase family protein [Pseudomonadota bacterium]
MGPILKLYMVLLPLVLGSALIEGLWLSRSRANGYDWKEWATSLGDVAVRRLLAFAPYGILAPVYFRIYDHRLFTLSADSVGGVLLLFVSLEFSYYWFHRASHTVRYFWNSHSVHHSPNSFTLAAAYRLGWIGKFSGATIFFTPMALLGFEPATVMIALQLNLIYQFWIHADWIPRLGWLEYVLNTPSAHRVHHSRNPEYLDANYGGVLIVFDRLFGSYIEERADVPCRYGLVTPVTTYNPIRINFDPWIGLAKDLASARSIREAGMFLFGPPGWRPDGTGLTTRELRAGVGGTQGAMT